jgi:hypothetical protein
VLKFKVTLLNFHVNKIKVKVDIRDALVTMAASATGLDMHSSTNDEDGKRQMKLQ